MYRDVIFFLIDRFVFSVDFEANDEPYAKTERRFKTVKKFSSSKDAKYTGGKDISYTGGCLSRPIVPVNGNLSCSSDGYLRTDSIYTSTEKMSFRQRFKQP